VAGAVVSEGQELVAADLAEPPAGMVTQKPVLERARARAARRDHLAPHRDLELREMASPAAMIDLMGVDERGRGYNWPMVELTEFAAERVKALAASDPEAKVLRLAIEGGGCSGFQYAIGFDTGSDDDDLVVDSHGVQVVIDPVSLPYLRGSRIDYRDGLMGAGFSFDNPNVQSTCGCNSSFQAKPEIEGPYSPKPDGCG
jgi:iron-sulfur cluster assembly accessory protein